MRGTSALRFSLGILLLGFLATSCIPNREVPVVKTPPGELAVFFYEKLLAYIDQGDRLLYSDNLSGRIVWNEQYFMESLVNMYQITGEKRYLELFVQHAENVLAQRDDRAGRRDYAGRSRPGWQIGDYYTLGIPVTIPDDKGQPSLEVQAVRRGGNNYTTVEIERAEDRFHLIVKNDFRREDPVIVRFDNLRLSTVENEINARLSPESYIRVRVVGDRPPSAGVYPLERTYRMVLHELHTPLIGLPFLRFAAVVLENDLEGYAEKAREYIRALEESARDYESSWREDAAGGYFVFEPGGKYWASGLPVPYNGLSANGRFFLWLYRVTGNREYLEKAAKLARKVRAGMRLLPDGTLTMPYWYGPPYHGWQGREKNPVNGLYVESRPYDGTEDVSHFSLTLLFMVDAYQMGLVFDEEELQAAANTFIKKIWKPGRSLRQGSERQKGVYLAHDLEGKGQAYDYTAAVFTLLAPWDPEIMRKALAVYQARYPKPSAIDLDYEYGYVMLGWSLLARENAPTANNFEDTPLYPFTPRASADEYVTSSQVFNLDEEGILVTKYRDYKRYNPNFIATYAFALYRDYLKSGDSALKDAFFKQADWLLKNRVERSYNGITFWVWEYNFDNPKFGATAPWTSALAQGRILCVFLKAYRISGDYTYLRAAERTFRSFLAPRQAGGVTTFEDEIAWYEEVADEQAPSSKILNGHISALAGLWTFWSWTGRQDVKFYLDLGIAAVKRDLPLYDAGVLSYYSQYPDQPRIFAPARGYNTFHVHQLLWLYDITGESIFLEYALQFARYDDPGWTITVAGSTDPQGHGPENLYFRMGTKYWSHNQFPTWVQIDLGSPQEVDGITMFGYIPKSTPKDYDILASEDGKKWKLLVQRRGNSDQYPVEKFAQIRARFIKIIIFNDNGNNNVALTGVGVYRVRGHPIAISDWKSFASGNRPAWIFTTGWSLPKEGWLIADLVDSQPKDLLITYTGKELPLLSFLGSSNLEAFQQLPFTKIKNGFLIENVTSRYLKIEIERAYERGSLQLQILNRGEGE